MMESRKDLGKLYAKHYEKGIGVEIGVQNGYNLLNISQDWPGVMVGVDIWPDESVLATAKETLKDARVVLFQEASVDAAERFTEGFLDWIYIDASHFYEDVKADFWAWYSKVRVGGVISFHDYGVNDCIGVKEFIDEFMTAHPEIEMNFTTDDFWEGKEYQTAWFIKPHSL